MWKLNQYRQRSRLRFMFYPFEVAYPTSGLHYRLNDSRLAELSLAPLPKEWNVAQAIAATPDAVWAESLSN
ncbi:hypothetical protein ACC771_25230, partial [Rhizobium ruizarguesonis]